MNQVTRFRFLWFIISLKPIHFIICSENIGYLHRIVFFFFLVKLHRLARLLLLYTYIVLTKYSLTRKESRACCILLFSTLVPLLFADYYYLYADEWYAMILESNNWRYEDIYMKHGGRYFVKKKKTWREVGDKSQHLLCGGVHAI